jgi:hypothetical protein
MPFARILQVHSTHYSQSGNPYTVVLMKCGTSCRIGSSSTQCRNSVIKKCSVNQPIILTSSGLQ